MHTCHHFRFEGTTQSQIIVQSNSVCSDRRQLCFNSCCVNVHFTDRYLCNNWVYLPFSVWYLILIVLSLNFPEISNAFAGIKNNKTTAIRYLIISWQTHSIVDKHRESYHEAALLCHSFDIGNIHVKKNHAGWAWQHGIGFVGEALWAWLRGLCFVGSAAWAQLCGIGCMGLARWAWLCGLGCAWLHELGCMHELGCACLCWLLLAFTALVMK